MKKQKAQNTLLESFLKHAKNLKKIFTVKKQQIDDTPPELYLKHIKELAELLSSDFKVQEDKLGFLGDCMADDIAEDWDVIGEMATVLQNNNIINQEICNQIKNIDNSFLYVSYGKKGFDKSVWTLKGIETHPFWQEQRLRAKSLLNELSKIDLN